MEAWTERLHLREFALSDGARLFAIESNPDMIRYQEFGPRTRESADAYVIEALEAAAARPRTWYELAICQDGDLIGRTGGGVASENPREIWIWYVVDAALQGQGIASEAVTAFVDLLESEGFARVLIECDPRNEPSWRLAERLGFQLVAESTEPTFIKGEPCQSRTYAKNLRRE